MQITENSFINKIYAGCLADVRRLAAEPTDSTLINGLISTIRLQLEAILKSILAEQYYNSDINTGINKLFEQNILTPVQKDALHFIRLQCNTKLHDINYQLSYENCLTILKTFCSTAEELYKSPVPIELKNYYQTARHFREIIADKKDGDKREVIHSNLNIIVKNISDNQKRENADNNYFVIWGLDENQQTCRIDISDNFIKKEHNQVINYGGKRTKLRNYIQSGMRIRFESLKYLGIYHNNSPSETQLKFGTDNSTLVILEPDYLENATSVAECFKDGVPTPENRLLNLLSAESEPNPYLIKGSLLNALFDELIYEPSRSDEEIYHCAETDNIFQLCTFALHFIFEQTNKLKERINAIPTIGLSLLPLELRTPEYQHFLSADTRNAYLETLKEKLELLLERKEIKDLISQKVSNCIDGVINCQKKFSLHYMPEVLRHNTLQQMKQMRERLTKLTERSNLLIEPTYYSPNIGLEGRLDLLFIQKKEPYKVSVLELKSGRISEEEDDLKPEHKVQTQIYRMLLQEITPSGRMGSCGIYYTEAKSNNIRRINYLHLSEKQDILMARNIAVGQALKLAFRPREVFSELVSFGSDNNRWPPSMQARPVQFKSAYLQLNEAEKTYLHTFFALLAREHISAKLGSSLLNNVVRANSFNIQKEEELPKSQSKNMEDFGFSGLWHLSLEEKQAALAIIAPLTIYTIGPTTETNPQISGLESIEKHHIVLTTESDTRQTDFRPGDLGVLYSMETGHPQEALTQAILNCWIVRIEPGFVEVSLRNEKIMPSYFDKNKKWAIEAGFMEKGFLELYSNLYRFIANKDQRKKNLVLGLEAPAKIESTVAWKLETSIPPEKITPIQEKIITKAINAPDYYLIQGPPGTGKTSVILASIILNLFNNTKQHIVILAFTNHAVEEISDKLIKMNLPFFRLGRSENPQIKTRKSLANEYRNSQKDFATLAQELANVRIIVSTISSYISESTQFPFIPKDTLIVDEASQLLEPHLVGIVVKFKRFILVGDEKQLPAVVTQSYTPTKAKDEKSKNVSPSPNKATEHLKAFGIEQVTDSFFERLLRICQQKSWTYAFDSLKEHSRMHKDIAHLINDPTTLNYYQGLSPLHARQTTALPFLSKPVGKLALKIAQHRVCYFDFEPEQGRIHEAQANFIQKILTELQESYQAQNMEIKPESIGVISPFNAQNALIYSKLLPFWRERTNTNEGKESVRRLVVDTVERFQGSERDIIIISLCINSTAYLERAISLGWHLINTENTVQKCSIDRKLNVMISRAKEQLVFLGCSKVLACNADYQKILAHTQKIGSYWNNQAAEE